MDAAVSVALEDGRSRHTRWLGRIGLRTTQPRRPEPASPALGVGGSSSAAEGSAQTRPGQQSAAVASESTTTADEVAGGAAAEPPERASTVKGRLLAANRLIALAHEESEALREELKKLPSSSAAGALTGRVAERASEGVLRAWAASLGRPKRAARVPTAAVSAPTVAVPNVQALITLWAVEPPTTVAAMGRWQRRALLARQALRRRWAWLRWELARRSEVFRRLFVARRAATDRSCSCTDRLIFSAALLGLCLSLLAALPAVVLLGVLLPFGTLFPIVQLVLSLATPHDSAILLLPWTLSAIHLALVAMMATLAPLVHRFQSLWADLLPTEGLPAAFFSPVFVEQIRKRHERALGAQPVFWDCACSTPRGPSTPFAPSPLAQAPHLEARLTRARRAIDSRVD